MNEFLEAVNDLNQELYEKVGVFEVLELLAEFSYSTNGYENIIKFGEVILWNDEMEEREWIEEKGDYEPLKPFLKRMLLQEIDKLIKVKNAFKTKER